MLDKLVFKQIGEFIARREGNDKEIEISASNATRLWISFYANKDYKGVPCPLGSQPSWDSISQDYETLRRQLRDKKVKYFLWVEKQWPPGAFDFLDSPYQKDFRKLGVWQHRDTGRMILFEVK